MNKDEEDIYWLTCTIVQEAGAEPYEGKLGVAWSIMNRVHKRGQRVLQVVLAPWQYSCYNTTSPTRKLLVTRTQATWDACYKAAQSAFHASEPDPCFGSTHYLRPDVLKRLPDWYRRDLVRAILGHHHFLVPAGE
jgi:spore germination cell wall hydrolase CwlJ-like protein